jgi:peptidoglycan hydrolase CwlO-like protein
MYSFLAKIIIRFGSNTIMTNEEKIKASAELKEEILRQLSAIDDDILQTQKQVFEHKNNVHQIKNELSEKTNLVLA